MPVYVRGVRIDNVFWELPFNGVQQLYRLHGSFAIVVVGLSVYYGECLEEFKLVMINFTMILADRYVSIRRERLYSEPLDHRSHRNFAIRLVTLRRPRLETRHPPRNLPVLL